jgi:hypothetical protein
MYTSGRLPRGSLGLPSKVVLALYMLAAALMPFGHHDLVCHLKSTTHCTTCTVGSSAEVAADPAALAKFWLVDAGAAICRASATAGLSARRPASGRAPPSFV